MSFNSQKAKGYWQTLSHHYGMAAGAPQPIMQYCQILSWTASQEGLADIEHKAIGTVGQVH